MSDTLKVILHFLFHIVIGAVLFAVIAFVAWLLDYGTNWIQAHGAPYFIVLGCGLVTELLFGLDVVCFVFFMFVEGWKLLREMASGLKMTGGGHGT